MKKHFGIIAFAVLALELCTPVVGDASSLVPPLKKVSAVVTANPASKQAPSSALGQDVVKKISNLTQITSISDILVPLGTVTTNLKSDQCPKPSAVDANEATLSLKNINSDSGFDSTYVPSDLVDVSTYFSTPGNQTICLRGEAAAALINMDAALKKNGLHLSVSSGYRSYSDQKDLYVAYAPTAKKVAYPRVAPAGHSEHQSGLAVDVASELSPGNFAQSAESNWIKNNAATYGFVVSYPENGEQKTGYMYEPWHLRFVGTENAKLLKTAEYTLAYKPIYYKPTSLLALLKNLKQKISTIAATAREIGG